RQNRCVAEHTGQPQRRRAFPVGGADVCAGPDELLHQFLVAMKHGPVKRRRAVGLRCVDVGLLREQLLNGRLVAAHRRVGQKGLLGSGSHREREHQDGKYRECASFHIVASFPSLSPMLSWLMPNLSRIVSSRLPVGTVFDGYAMCRLPFTLPFSVPM